MTDPRQSAFDKFITTGRIIQDSPQGARGGVYLPLSYNGGMPLLTDEEKMVIREKFKGLQPVSSYKLENGVETSGVFIPEESNPGIRENLTQAKTVHEAQRVQAHEAEMKRLKGFNPNTHIENASARARVQLDLMNVPEFKIVDGTGGPNIPIHGKKPEEIEKIRDYLTKQGFEVGDGHSSRSGMILKLKGESLESEKVKNLVEDQARVHGGREPVPNNSSGEHSSNVQHNKSQRGHAHIGVMGGIAATVLVGTIALQEARAAGYDLKGQFGKVASAVFPTGAALARGRKAEAVASFIDRVDPTLGLGSGVIRDAMRGVGLDVEQSLLSSTPKNVNPQKVIRDNKINNQIDREQTALFDSNHPDQLSTLKIVDPKTGKKMDTAALLKDPVQRHVIFDEIRQLEKSTKTPDGREGLAHMREAAQQFVDLEKRRRPTLDSASNTMSSGLDATKQIAASPTVGGLAGGPG